MTVQTNYEIDIAGELERVDADLAAMEAAGGNQIQFSFFGGRKDEKEVLAAIIRHVKERGYVCEVEYEDGEIWLTVLKA